MRLFSKENQECSMMIFYSETLGFELEAMMCAVRDGTFSGAPLTYFNDGGGRGGGKRVNF